MSVKESTSKIIKVKFSSLLFFRRIPGCKEVVHLSQVKLQVSSKAKNQNPGSPNPVTACVCRGHSWYGSKGRDCEMCPECVPHASRPGLWSTSSVVSLGLLPFFRRHTHMCTPGVRSEKLLISYLGKKKPELLFDLFPWKPALLSSRVCYKAD